MIYTQPTTYEMINDLCNDEYASWTYDEASALVDYYDQLSEDCDINIEWDTVAIRCEWSSYATIQEVNDTYSDLNAKTVEDLEEHTQVLECADGTLLIQDF
jgi:hypothetical protein